MLSKVFSLMVFVMLLGCSPGDVPPSDIEYDLKITGARIVDGSGAKGFNGTVLINDGKIVYAGKSRLRAHQAKTIIDANGRVVSPGFIDPHAHGNAEMNPEFRNFWSMGVTTILLGLDGSSPGIEDLEQWFSAVEEARPGVNVAHMVGHGTARRFSGIGFSENPSSDEIDRLVDVIDAQLKVGSFGVSTGLEYIPGTFAGRDELARVARKVAEYDGVIMSHMRSEDDDTIVESVGELIQMGRDGNARVHVSHIKIVYGNDISDAETVISVMDAARKDGVDITADVYPYTASFTGIGILYPEWALPPNDFSEVVATRRSELAEYLRNRVNRRNGPEATLIGTAPWAGKTLAEIASEKNKPFEDVLIDHLPPGSASGAYFVMNLDVMRRFLQDRYIMVSSDGSPTMRHPRGYGSFARILRQFVSEEGAISLEEAIFKMSGQTAEVLRLDRAEASNPPRGLLRSGFAADVLIFDSENVRDRATFENPHQYATGFDYVIINGVLVQADGEPTGSRAGQVLRKQ